MKKWIIPFVLAMVAVLVYISNDTTQAGPVTAQGYVTVAGGRVYDSRKISSDRLGAGQVVTVDPGIANASAIAVNITLTETTGPGYVAAWASGPWPGTSIINSSEANESIANFAIIPVAPDGTFQLMTQRPAHLLVDVMGYIAGDSEIIPGGITLEVTGYRPISTTTFVSGTATNGTAQTMRFRVNIICPDRTVYTASIYELKPGQTKGWEGYCSGNFTSGVTLSWVEI